MKLPKAYAGVTFLTSALTFNYMVTMDQERIRRTKMFNDQFLHFTANQDKHLKEVGDELALQGYPDDGNGRYMEAQGYAAWYFLNVTKRLHKNDYEHLVTLLPLSLVNGIIYPWTTIGLLSVYFGGRMFFTYGYQEKEGAFNKYRLIGSVLVNLSKMATFGVTMYCGYQLSSGKLILQKALGIL